MSVRILSIAIVAAVSATAASVPASAAEATRVADSGNAHADGMMQFPNVTVVSTDKPANLAATAPAAASGMRAFKDKDTGQLRSPTVEEMTEATAAQPAQRSARAPLASRTLSTGMRAVLLDSSFNAYAVARKSADGGLEMECAEGESKALAAVTAAPAKENSNDR